MPVRRIATERAALEAWPHARAHDESRSDVLGSARFRESSVACVWDRIADALAYEGGFETCGGKHESADEPSAERGRARDHAVGLDPGS